MNLKFSRLPVVDNDGNLVGIITQTDIFRVLVSLTGVREKGIQFGFLLEDRPGSIKEVGDIIRKYDCRMVSIMSSGNGNDGFRHVYIRICDCDRDKIDQLKEELKSNGNMLYVADHVEKTREFYQEYQRPSAAWAVG